MNRVETRVSQLLDVSDPAEQVEYERAFFVGFQRATHNRLVRQLWEWDDAAGRLRTRIPYSDQRIWVLRSPDRTIEAAIAVNTTMRELQAAAYGFSMPEQLTMACAQRAVCEFLTFFAVREHGLARKQRWWAEIFDDLRKLGYTHGLATCSPKVFAVYAWMGAKRIGHTKIGSEERYFLLFDLKETPSRQA